jgi:hypothetical protein
MDSGKPSEILIGKRMDGGMDRKNRRVEMDGQGGT